MEGTREITPKMSEAVQVGGIVDTGAESFTVDAKAAAPKTNDADLKDEGKKTQAQDPPAKAEGDDKGAEKKNDTGADIKADDDLKLTIKTDDDFDDDKDLPKGVVKRLGKMRAKLGDSERENDKLRAENAALKAAKDRAALDSEEPDVTKFETEAEYLKALTAYQVKKTLADQAVEATKKDVESANEQEEKEKAERHSAIQKNLREAEKKFSDFKAVVIENPDVVITEQMVDIMMDLPNMGEIAYRLGKNPDLSAQIAGMTITKQAFALKEISDQIKSKKTTKAPEPIRSIGATGGDIKALKDMSYPEYVKYMNKREQERRGG